MNLEISQADIAEIVDSLGEHAAYLGMEISRLEDLGEKLSAGIVRAKRRKVLGTLGRLQLKISYAKAEADLDSYKAKLQA